MSNRMMQFSNTLPGLPTYSILFEKWKTIVH